MKKVLLLGYDGYIGCALTQRLLKEGYAVVGVDNEYRRHWVENEFNSCSCTDIMTRKERDEAYQKMGKFIGYNMDIIMDDEAFVELLKQYKPDVLINLAHIPSAPFSMKSEDFATYTLMNNVIGTNKILWGMKAHCPNCHYITIGTTGEYDHYSNVDVPEGYFTFEYEGRKSSEMIFPRRPGSVYHASKVASTYIIDYLTRIWNLKSTDIMQGVVFGAYTDEIVETGINTRFDVDEAAGTALNRFIAQAKLGMDLTVYGEGEQQRPFIALNDSIQALMIAIKNEPTPGKARVWNQLSEWISINDLADKVIKQVPEVKKNYYGNPRKEKTEPGYYAFKTDILKSLGYKPTRTIDEEIEYVLKTLNKENLERAKDAIYPKVIFNEPK